MKTISVADAKMHLSSVLKSVSLGEEIAISYGKKKETIAVILSIEEYKKIKRRQLGSLKGKVTVEFSKDFKISDNEFFKS